MGNISTTTDTLFAPLTLATEASEADAGNSSEVTRLHPQSDGNCCE